MRISLVNTLLKIKEFYILSNRTIAGFFPSTNDSIYSLAASIWTRDINKAHLLAAEIKVGLVWINYHGLPDMAVSFGGYKQSGWGRENGYEGLLEYMELKSVIAML